MLTALPDGRLPLLLAAHAADLLPAEAAGLLDYLAAHPGVGVDPVAQMLLRTRPVRRHRTVIRAADRTELRAGLRAVAAGAQHPLVSRSDRAAAGRTAFVFPGQGTQWPGMGAELLKIAGYRTEARRCDDAFRRAGQSSPLGYLAGAPCRQTDPVLVQAAQFSHAAALAATWRGFQVLPDITVGHSLGELAAAYTAGVIDLDAAVAVVVARSVLTASPPGVFGMATLSISAADVAELVDGAAGWLELSVVNGPASVVVSGELAAVRAAVHRVSARGAFARELPVRYPAHTSALAALRDRMLQSVPDAQFHSTPIEFIGSTLGGPIPDGADFRAYWYDNLRNPVRFDRAVAAAVERGAGTFIEMSAHPTLLAVLADTAGAAQLLGSTVRDQPAGAVLSANVVAAAVADPGYRWRDRFAPAAGAPLRGFPPAPMRATRLWIKPEVRQPQPVEAPITAVEDWLPAAQPGPAPPGGGPAAVIDYTGRSGELAAVLRAALPGAAAAPGDAELLVLVAPTGPDHGIAAAVAAFAGPAAAQAAITPGPRCARVWLVTRGAEQTGGDPPPQPGPAALAALHRSIGFEHPDQVFAHLDLPAEPTAADLRAGLAALRGPQTEVAVRDGRALTRRLRRCPPDGPAAPARVPKTVLITGGTGAIGLACAAYCARHGARDITLLSRSGSDGGTADRLRDITARTGARITALRCDITDAGAVAALAARHRPAPAGLLIHTASAPARAGAAITDATVRDAFGAKVIGAENVIGEWPLRADAAVLVCSSVLALWGGAGHGLYAAANRMADVLTGRLRAQGRDANAIRWGLWRAVAVVAGAEKDRIARTGLSPMAPDAAIAAGLAAPRTDPAILAADWDRLAVFFDSQGLPSPFEAAQPATVSATAPGRPLPQLVAAELAAVLRIGGETGDPTPLDMGCALVDLGLDSLLALDLRNRLHRATGRRVPLARLLGGISGAELVGCLHGPAGDGAAEDRAAGDGSAGDRAAGEQRPENSG